MAPAFPSQHPTPCLRLKAAHRARCPPRGPEQKRRAYKICSVRPRPSDTRDGPFWKVSCNS